MTTRPSSSAPPQAGYRYPSPNIPMSAIRRFARKLGERFHPEKIILFGSYAYGTPHEESDVDLLVVTPTRNEIDESIKYTVAFDPPFSLDLIVRTPERLKRDIEDGDWFLREIVSKGKVVYDENNGTVGAKSRVRSRRSPKARRHARNG
jgi:predicted nucleotidyltransferase